MPMRRTYAATWKLLLQLATRRSRSTTTTYRTPVSTGGSEAARRQADWESSWESWRWDPEEFIEAGERVVAVLRVHARGRARVASMWNVSTLRCGRCETANACASTITAARAGPRSRRAVGVGDVAGERGDRAASRFKAGTGGDRTRASAVRPGGLSFDPRPRGGRRRLLGHDGARVGRTRSRSGRLRRSRSTEVHRRRATGGRRHEWRGTGQGRRGTGSSSHVWTLREGKIVRVRVHWEPAEALEAAGLSE